MAPRKPNKGGQQRPPAKKVSTPGRQRAFLVAFAETGNIRLAAKTSGINRSTHYDWLEADDDYRRAFEAAQQEAAEVLEAEAHRRAVAGTQRLKFNRQGQPIIDPRNGQPYIEHEYSDVLLIFLLKGLMPEKYRERSQVDMSATLAGNLSIDQLRERAKRLGIPSADSSDLESEDAA